MYIFSYCPFLAPPIITSCYYIALVIRNSKPCGGPPLPRNPRCCPRSPVSCSAATPAKSVWCSELHPVSHFAYPHPRTDASCFYKSDISLWLGFLVSVKAETRERDGAGCSPMARFGWVHQRPNCVWPTTFGLPQPLRQCVWVCACGYLYVYPALVNVWTGGSY